MHARRLQRSTPQATQLQRQCGAPARNAGQMPAIQPSGIRGQKLKEGVKSHSNEGLLFMYRPVSCFENIRVRDFGMIQGPSKSRTFICWAVHVSGICGSMQHGSRRLADLWNMYARPQPQSPCSLSVGASMITNIAVPCSKRGISQNGLPICWLAQVIDVLQAAKVNAHIVRRGTKSSFFWYLKPYMNHRVLGRNPQVVPLRRYPNTTPTYPL